jgi:putative hydrolase of HD superfamily
LLPEIPPPRCGQGAERRRPPGAHFVGLHGRRVGENGSDDLPEALVGDSVPGERTRTEKRRGEEAAMRRMLKDLPKDISRRYSSIWEEYEEGVSEEARLVKHVDKLELALQAREYRMADRGNDVSDFFASARKGLDDADILRMVEGLA